MSGDSSLEDLASPAPSLPTGAAARDWCLLTLTEGGKLSMQTALAAGEAQIAAQAIAPAWMRPGASGGSCYFGDNKHEIKKLKVFRGSGDVMDIWTGKVSHEPLRL